MTSIILCHLPMAGTDMYPCGECEVTVAHDQVRWLVHDMQCAARCLSQMSLVGISLAIELCV